MTSISKQERLTVRLTLLNWGSLCFFAGMSTSMFLIWGLHGGYTYNLEEAKAHPFPSSQASKISR